MILLTNFGIFLEPRFLQLGFKLGFTTRFYKIENISNPYILTLAVNPKEYPEMFKDLVLNKKHKGIKMRSSGMRFENFVGRMKSLVNFETFEKPPAEYQEVSRLFIVQGEMIKKTVVKTKFSQLNNKRFYFPDGIVSLPFSHKNLQQIDHFKREKGQKIEKYFREEKEVLFKMEKEVLKNNPRLYFTIKSYLTLKFLI